MSTWNGPSGPQTNSSLILPNISSFISRLVGGTECLGRRALRKREKKSCAPFLHSTELPYYNNQRVGVYNDIIKKRGARLCIEGPVRSSIRFCDYYNARVTRLNGDKEPCIEGLLLLLWGRVRAERALIS